MSESAIMEEDNFETPDSHDDIDEPQHTADDYDIEEPEDDDEYIVPMIDNLDEDEDSTPSHVKKEADSSVKTPEKAEQPASEKDKAEEQESALPDDLVEKAKKLGVSDEDIALYEKPEQLETLCSLIEPKPEKQETEESPKDKETSKETSDESGEFQIELDPDLYDPDLCKAMKSTSDQINGLKNMLNTVVSMVHRQSEQSFESDFEGFITELGDGFSETLGKGTLDEIGTDSKFFRNRCKVIEEMNAIAAGYSQTGKSVPSPKQIFQRAVNGIFGDTIQKNARKDIAGQLQKRSSQIVSRPTGKNGKGTQTPDQRATNVVKEKLREFGAYDHDEVEEEF